LVQFHETFLFPNDRPITFARLVPKAISSPKHKANGSVLDKTKKFPHVLKSD